MYRTGRQGPANILYEYQSTRASKHPRRFLSGFKGYLHVDGYAGYNGIPDIKLVGCFAHARRKFTDALKALPESAKSTKLTANEGLDYCNKLFKIERDLKDVTTEEHYKARLERSQPVLDAFSAWLREQKPKVLPKSALGQAIEYCRNQWDRLVVFLEDGRLEIDNNRSERSIEPFVSADYSPTQDEGLNQASLFTVLWNRQRKTDYNRFITLPICLKNSPIRIRKISIS
ncbi:hypothetical protein BCO26_0356 [Heyndrickxia coagulans 2-6]|nr:hypothetical protein BCO26_0356 [Heyndrickxia coagulans 2-6]